MTDVMTGPQNHKSGHWNFFPRPDHQAWVVGRMGVTTISRFKPSRQPKWKASSPNSVKGITVSDSQQICGYFQTPSHGFLTQNDQEEGKACTLDKIIQHVLFSDKVIQYRVSTEYEFLIVKFQRLYDRNRPSTAKLNTHTDTILCVYMFLYVYIYTFKGNLFPLVMALQINEYKQISRRMILWLNYNYFN